MSSKFKELKAIVAALNKINKKSYLGLYWYPKTLKISEIETILYDHTIFVPANDLLSDMIVIVPPKKIRSKTRSKN